MRSEARRQLVMLRLRGEQVARQQWGPRPDGPLPLSFAQQRLWFLDQLEPGSVEYIVPMPVTLRGVVDVRTLNAALNAITRRHEVLRTRLVAGTDGTAYQVIDPPDPLPLPVVDASGASDSRDTAKQLVEADAATPFDLSAGPLIRAWLIRVNAEEHVLALCAHHVVFDEWSARIFRRELTLLCEAFSAGEPDPLPPMPVQYADFAVWQRGWLTGQVLVEHLAYWRQQLAGAPVLEMPTDRSRPPVRSPDGALVEFAVSAKPAAGLRAVADEAGATMFMTTLAAFAVLLGRYCGQDDIVVGTPAVGRSRTETEDLIGFFVNTLVMRIDLTGDPSFAELLARIRRIARDAYAHQDLPFEKLVEQLVTDRDRSRTPLFQVFFSYVAAEPESTPSLQNAVRNGANAAEARPREMVAGSRPAKFDLSVGLAEYGPDLIGSLHYSTALFDAATVVRMAGHLGVLLAGVAADPAAPLSGLPVLTAGEREQLVAGWNATAVPVPAAGGVHELIAGRAGVCPDAVAVVAGDTCLTYGALVGRAGRLAGYLRQEGVGAESVVGLCLGRGAGMVTGVLAVWLAGAAYVPLDPGYPAARLGFMVADSRARLLVSDGAGLEGDLPGGGRGGAAG